MQARNTHRRGFAVLLIVVVLVATVVAVLGGPSGVPASAAAPLGPAAPAGQISNGWELALTAPAYPDGTPFHFYGMTFASREVGFAYGGQAWNEPDKNPDGTVRNPGRVYRTVNGGVTWQLVFENKGWKIGGACSDELHCWVGGKGGQIYYTSDGGDKWYAATEYTWQGMENYPTPPLQTPVPFTAWIRSAGVAPGGNPVLFGATDNTVLYSTNGSTFYNYWPMLSWYSATWSVACPSSAICYGGQTGRFIVKSTDAGATWTMPAYASDYTGNCLTDKYPAPDNGIQRRYYGLSFLDPYYGWAVGSCGMIFRTKNGAASRWERQASGVPEEVIFRRVQAFSTKSVITVGGTNPDPADPSMAQNAIVYLTTDGTNWQQAAAPDTSELHGLAGFGDATYVADWSGKIWRWTGELVPVPASTSTPTPTAETTATSTPTETMTPTPTGSVAPTETPTATPTTGSAKGSIEVQAFVDANLDGKPDQGETPLGGAGFSLSVNTTPVASGVTGADGRYIFADLDAGTYGVAEMNPPQGYTALRTSPVFVGIVAGSAPVLPFPHSISTVTPYPTATPTGTAVPRHTWLPMVLR